jgi:L-aspartate oxidase
LQEHFPQIYQTLLELGIDITTDPIPVAPTAHYSCGGVVTSANGLTDVAGLYAAGEVAYTGLHGANRLASNSLLECVVVGRNIATDLPRYLAALETLETTLPDTDLNESIYDTWTAPTLKDSQRITLPSPIEYESNSNGNHNDNVNTDADITGITVELKALMTSHMGITRDAQQLEQALLRIQQWQQQLNCCDSNQLSIDNKDDATILNELPYFQLARQLQLATLIIQSAYQRHESRGGHYRKDYPNLTSIPRTSVIEPLLKQSDEQNLCIDKSVKHSQDHLPLINKDDALAIGC